MKFFCTISTAAAILLPLVAFSQNPPLTPEQQEKQMLEFIDSEVKRLSSLLDLEYWQEFYVDSTLTHDYSAMIEELDVMKRSKVENQDLYINVRDKWMEKVDSSYRRIFNEAQWKKYWKAGGERASKIRAKRKK